MGLEKRHFGWVTIFWGVHHNLFGTSENTVLSVLQEVLQVVLGVHRYKKCDLIGDDQADKHDCNGYNKTQVIEKMSHI